MKKKAYDYSSVIAGLKDKSKQAFTKLAGEIETNAVLALQVAHGKLKSKTRVSVGAVWANVDKDTAKMLAGRAVGMLNEAWQGGLFESSQVGSTYAHFSGTTMVSLGSTPIGALLVRSMHKAVTQAVADIGKGEVPRSIMYPEVTVDRATKVEAVEWMLSYRLGRATIVAMGEEPGKTLEDIRLGIAKLVKKGAAPKPAKKEKPEVKPMSQLEAELGKTA